MVFEYSDTARTWVKVETFRNSFSNCKPTRDLVQRCLSISNDLFDSHWRRQNIQHQKVLQHYKTLLQLMIMISLVSLKAGAIINLHNYYDLVWHYKTKIKSIKINFTFWWGRNYFFSDGHSGKIHHFRSGWQTNR